MSKSKSKPYFEDKYHVRRVKHCCGSCRYYYVDQDRDERCDHPEVDNCANCNGYFIDAGYICDLWETDER